MTDEETYFLGLFLVLAGAWTLYISLRDGYAPTGYGIGYDRGKRPVLYWLATVCNAVVPIVGLRMLLGLFFPDWWE